VGGKGEKNAILAKGVYKEFSSWRARGVNPYQNFNGPHPAGGGAPDGGDRGSIISSAKKGETSFSEGGNRRIKD